MWARSPWGSPLRSQTGSIEITGPMTPFPKAKPGGLVAKSGARADGAAPRWSTRGARRARCGSRHGCTAARATRSRDPVRSVRAVPTPGRSRSDNEIGAGQRNRGPSRTTKSGPVPIFSVRRQLPRTPTGGRSAAAEQDRTTKSGPVPIFSVRRRPSRTPSGGPDNEIGARPHFFCPMAAVADPERRTVSRGGTGRPARSCTLRGRGA